ncbi:MAG: hypothetical protein ABSH46_13990 [Bryobacteraceae bacterium]|jgi:hypothetical protein
MSVFQTSYSPLSASNPQWGAAACLPWDEAIFGFPVAELRVGSQTPARGDVSDFRAALEQFAARARAELISVRFSAHQLAWVELLCQAGFIPVDLSIEASHGPLRLEAMPKPRFGVRLAAPDDFPDLLRIAGCAFHFGRYHADPRFPRELADRRYVHWLRNALESADSNEYIFVLGSAAQRLGFFHAVLREGGVDLRLAAADPGLPVGLGPALYSETLLALQQMGARRFVTKVSAANMGVVNLYASIGFRFSNPAHIFHWHAPGANHLL